MVDKKKIPIPKWAACHLNNIQLEEISKATIAAERTTAAEIVPMIVRSSAYSGYLDNLMFPILASMFFIFDIEEHVLHLFNIWDISAWHVVGIKTLLLVVSWFTARYLANLDQIKRLFLDRADVIAQVNHRAELEFYRSGLQKTSGGTGILIFVSLLEHRAVILGDHSIDKLIAKDTWQVVLTKLLTDIKTSGLSAALQNSVTSVAQIAKPHFPRLQDDINELHDQLIIKE